jgi:hypothetical protein
MKLADKAGSMAEQAKEAERKAEAIDRAMSTGGETFASSGEEQVSSKPRPTSSELCKILKGIELLPRSGKRTDISRTTAALDDLKSAGTLQLWDSSTQVGALSSNLDYCLGSSLHTFSGQDFLPFSGCVCVCVLRIFPRGCRSLNPEPHISKNPFRT